MEETLISLEAGKLAKEKGFDWKVESYYHKSNGKETPYTRKSTGYRTDEIVCTNWNDGQGSYPTLPNEVNCSAPTQSLLQKWLRDVHNLHIRIQPMLRFDQIYPSKYTSHIEVPFDPFKHKPSNYQIGDTYEEALEKALIEALKLIKK